MSAEIVLAKIRIPIKKCTGTKPKVDVKIHLIRRFRELCNASGHVGVLSKKATTIGNKLRGD